MFWSRLVGYFDFYYAKMSLIQAQNIVIYVHKSKLSNEDMILALAGQFKLLSHEAEKLLEKCEDHIFIWFQTPHFV